MHICFACDKNYLHYLYITISSILHSAKSSDNHNFYILQSDFTDYEKDIINKLQNIKKFNIEYLHVDESKLEGCRKEGYHIPIQTFYRYLIADLKPELDKIIYLDVDVEVVGSLNEMWNIDIEGYYLGAALDTIVYKDKEHKEKIGINSDSDYFNAGVLILNLEEFRKNNLMKILVKSSIDNQNKFSFGDQDALNVTSVNKFKVIDRKYNFRATLLRDIYTTEDLKGIENSIIKHYVGKDKKFFNLFHYLTGYPILLKVEAAYKYKKSLFKFKYINIKHYTLNFLKNIPVLGDGLICLKKAIKKCLKRK